MDSAPEELEGERLLEKLWREPAKEDLQCLLCQKPFTTGALIRTFRISSLGPNEPDYSAVVSTPKGDIILFDRHMDCVISHKVDFWAISHVWDPIIAKVQQQRHTIPETPGAAHRALEISFKIYHGIKKSGNKGEELWLDYLSVPQWSDALRVNILQIMHKLYNTAQTTILYLDDISQTTVNRLYQEKRSQERLDSVIYICNSNYFKRVWTAMEFIRSCRVRMAVGDCTYLADLDDPAFMNRLWKVWNEEVKHYKLVQQLENKVKMGKNQVPWSLGTLTLAKALKRFNFAMATALLCKRGCRDRMDFLHALRGIVRADSTALMGSDFKTEYYRVAWDCLKAGDMSPLLITPSMGEIETRGPGHWSEFGYNDVFTWSIGQETQPPALRGDNRFNESDQLISLKLEEIGVVSVIRRAFAREQPFLLRSFSYAAKIALEFDGPDVKDFVAAMERTHGAAASTTMKDLEDKNQVHRLQEVLTRLYNSPDLLRWPINGDDSIDWLADVLQFTKVQPGSGQTVLAANSSGFGTIHCAPYDYTVGITCLGCHRTFAHKVASFVLPTELQQATAYRIPGLKYATSHANGVGLLVKNGRVVGRMVWATPACTCERTETVTLGLPEFFLPKAFAIND
ncbi:hypothetical protein F53441_477 [Fusarium austroafricanum]|uniref:Heterokaryon incompatibility domain-containing protein n=1 Tax=Fusarium austroafricanum TaxID=2364996 RepID=A0A8H4P034_9HYPO|nr:hypothetical protein F53441_477 [Fusarium austroafricanum]